ncbi:MAG: site-specific integrase [Achromobacter sp.]|uniref:tyrosine-type recombinase/integrase n=1 Tax=Achromobacter sp. TaxID=134375 RepID=UPI00258C39B8|nr:site-specific integrase [Achromobacter sp.]MCW0206024.1 site-specific integrase [Achromobacter sp.]
MPKRNPGARLEWREDRRCWEIIWYERGQRKRKSAGTADRAIADQRLAEHLIPAEPIGPRDPTQRRIAEALTDYATERAEHIIGKATLGYNIKALWPFWAHLTVSIIRENTCRGYVAHRAGEGVSASTAGRELSVLGAALRHDWKAGRLTELVPVWLPPKADPKDRWLTRSEAAALLRACRDNREQQWHLALFIRLGLYTGARAEAILSLRWPQVDLERRLIDFNPPGRARTKKGRPIIPIPGRLLAPLRAARRRGTDLGPVLHYFGEPVGSVKKAFARACQRAELEDVTPHTLRHTCASWLAQQGVPFPVIARYLGHSDSRTTERVYAHHAPDYLEAARRALDGAGRRR